MRKLILSFITVHGGPRPIPNFYSLLHPPFVSILFSTPFYTGSGNNCATNFIHFRFMFIETGTKFSFSLPDVTLVAIDARNLINSIIGVLWFPFVLRIPKLVPWGSCEVSRQWRCCMISRFYKLFQKLLWRKVGPPYLCSCWHHFS